MSPSHHELLRRLHPLPAAALGRGRSRQGPAGDRAGDARAGRHRALAAPASSRAAPAWRWPSTAPRRSRSRPSTKGIAQAATRDKILVSVFFDGGIDALSVLAPVGDPRYSQLRPNLALSPGEPAPRSARTRACSWHPAAAGLATLHGEGKVSAFPAIGYDHPDQSHFTSRHFYEVGELDGRLPHRLARPLHRHRRRRREPAAGPLDGRLALADARHRGQAGGGDRQRRRLRPLVAGRATRSRARCSAASPASAPCRRTRRRWRRCATRPPRPTSCARTSAGSATSPARSPTPTPTSPTSSPASPPSSPPGCRCGR